MHGPAIQQYTVQTNVILPIHPDMQYMGKKWPTLPEISLAEPPPPWIGMCWGEGTGMLYTVAFQKANFEGVSHKMATRMMHATARRVS
mmetsp:Transcript_47056/g.77328  ORF Transcript_47056/g.77328 Transcript_47056/m.77328 type:complete len:88 (-) Transcript_47056:232-495(-)